jgi:ribose 5-phosphate isomerase
LRKSKGQKKRDQRFAVVWMLKSSPSSSKPKPNTQNCRRSRNSTSIISTGSGSTATLWIKLLGEQVRDHGLEIRAIASSEDSERLGRSYGIPFVSFEECRTLDLTVDGAEEIAPGLALIKGGGGKRLREKIVASASTRRWAPLYG